MTRKSGPEATPEMRHGTDFLVVSMLAGSLDGAWALRERDALTRDLPARSPAGWLLAQRGARELPGHPILATALALRSL